MRHHHTTNDEDFEIINGKKCLRDGHRYRVGPITMMDSLPRGGHGPVRITDGGLGLHRPVYRQFNFDEKSYGAMTMKRYRDIYDDDLLRDGSKTACNGQYAARCVRAPPARA
jgi:hypothetical protein